MDKNDYCEADDYDMDERLRISAESLALLDKNTVEYMIEELQKELQKEVAEKNKQEKLSVLLIKANRIEDLIRSYEDKDYQQHLFEEFEL